MQELIFSWQHKAHQSSEFFISLRRKETYMHIYKEIYIYIYKHQNSVNPQLSLVKFRGQEINFSNNTKSFKRRH